MAVMLRAVDSSFDELTDQEARCLKNNGWPLFIQCLLALPRTGPEQPAKRVVSLRNALEHGMPTAGYIVVGGSRPGPEYINLGRAGVPDDIWRALKFVAVDVETPGVRVDNIIAAVNRVKELGKLPLIYTNANTWLNYISPANDTQLAQAGVLLWNAYWDDDPDIDFARLPFGGWRVDQVALEQWSGGTYICGQFVDRNTVARPELINLEGGGEHMPTPEYNELKQRLDTLQAGSAAVATDLAGRIEAVRTGEAMTSVWPAGEVKLRQVYHRGYHAHSRLNTLTRTVQAARRTLEEHLVQHNISGGPLDRYSGEHLKIMADLLDQIEAQVRALAVAAGEGRDAAPNV